MLFFHVCCVLCVVCVCVCVCVGVGGWVGGWVSVWVHHLIIFKFMKNAVKLSAYQS